MNCYRINNTCIYNEEKSELRNIENSCAIRMTSMRARCLTYLIKNANSGIIEKHQLCTALWGSRGQFVSDASLTQILYLIRRDLRMLGIQDMFTTIPRLGVKVNDKIDIVTENVQENKISKWRLLAIILFAILIIFIMTFFIFFDITHFII